MKKLFKQFADILPFFTEKRFVYEEMPVAQPQPEAEAESGRAKLPKIDISDDSAANFMLQQAEKEADAMFKSSAFESARFNEPLKKSYEQALRTLVSDNYTRNISNLGIIVDSVLWLKPNAPKFDSANSNKNEAQRKLDEARVAFIMSHFSEYKNSIDAYQGGDAQFMANLNIRKKPTSYEEVLDVAKEIKLTNKKEKLEAARTLIDALLDEGSAENKDKDFRQFAETEIEYALKELPAYEQLLSAVYLFAQQNRLKDINKLADKVADELVKYAEKTDNQTLSKRFEEILYEKDDRPKQDVDITQLADRTMGQESETDLAQPADKGPEQAPRADIKKDIIDEIGENLIKIPKNNESNGKIAAKKKTKREIDKPKTTAQVKPDTKRKVPNLKIEPPNQRGGGGEQTAAKEQTPKQDQKEETQREVKKDEKLPEPKIVITEKGAQNLYEYGQKLLSNGHNAKNDILKVYSALKNSPEERINSLAANLLFGLAKSEEKSGYYENSASLYDRILKDFRGVYDPTVQDFRGGTEYPVTLGGALRDKYSIKELDIKSKQCFFLHEMQTILKKKPGETVDPHNLDQVADFFNAEKKYGHLPALLNNYLKYFFDHAGYNIKDTDPVSKIYPDSKLGIKKVDCQIFADVAKSVLRDSISDFRYILGGKNDEKQKNKIVGTHTMALITLDNGDKFIINNNSVWQLPNNKKYTETDIVALIAKKLPEKYAPEQIKILGNGESPKLYEGDNPKYKGMYAGNFDSGVIYPTKPYFTKTQPIVITRRPPASKP